MNTSKPAFTKKHYEAVARALGEALAHAEGCGDMAYVEGAEMVGASLVRMFKQDNPAFDPARFVEAIQRTETER